MTNRKAAFYTLGCKLNFAETSAIARQLVGGGYEKTDFESPADVYVINTCTVTDHADRKCRNIVRQALRTSPEAFIVVTGCYAQLKPEEIANIEGVDLVLGANEKFNILSYLNSLEKREETGIHACEITKVKQFSPSYSSDDRTRSFLKVQDGCDYFCAFCTIPLARGTSRSADIESTVKAAAELANTGVKEIVLTGVNIGDFGKANEEKFIDLIKALDNISTVERFRISSIEPNLLTDGIIEFVATSNKFVPHFHIPLQSGSDKILESMRRRYRTELYRQRIDKIKSVMPHACIGADVIVGFPGESESDFMDTYNFLNELQVSYLHVFTYSERENTTAIRLTDVVPMQERSKRNKMLTILSEKKKRRFYEDNSNRTLKVLFEHENKGGFMYGFSENYIRVKHPFNADYVNKPIVLTIGKQDFEGVYQVENFEKTPSSVLV